MLRRDTYDADDLLLIGDAAALVRVHPDTLRRWAAAGKIPVRRTPGGKRVFQVRDLRALVVPAPRRPAPADEEQVPGTRLSA